ncbi:hypothetical protein CW304_23525 [Bacillus sp. UFRGS-B20]|nr:hypothetical protein CW304_23525 [Bacillus sp. UFRGS-B20]
MYVITIGSNCAFSLFHDNSKSNEIKFYLPAFTACLRNVSFRKPFAFPFLQFLINAWIKFLYRFSL